MITVYQLLYTGRAWNLTRYKEYTKRFLAGESPVGKALIASSPKGVIKTLREEVETFMRGFINYRDEAGKKRIGERHVLLRTKPFLFTTDALLEGRELARHYGSPATLSSIENELLKRPKITYQPKALQVIKEYVDAWNRAILRDVARYGLVVTDGMRAALEKHNEECRIAKLPAAKIEIPQVTELKDWQEDLRGYLSYIGKVRSIFKSEWSKKYFQLVRKLGQWTADQGIAYIDEATNELGRLVSMILNQIPVDIEKLRAARAKWRQMIKTTQDRLEIKLGIPEPDVDIEAYAEMVNQGKAPAPVSPVSGGVSGGVIPATKEEAYMNDVVRVGYLTGFPEIELKVTREPEKIEVQAPGLALAPEKKIDWLPWLICGVQALVIIGLLARGKK